jgi:hypothetical protein
MKEKSRIVTTYYFLLFWALIESVWWIKSPELFHSFYGEDARIFGTQALSSSFPSDLFIKHSGYMHLLPRILVRISLFLPLEIAPVLLTTLVAGVIAFLCSTVLVRLSYIINNRMILVSVTFSFALLPISNFESLGNAANLHFFLTAAAVLMLYFKAEGKYNNFQGFLICFFAATSDPFLLVFVLIAFASLKRNHTKISVPSFWQYGALYGWLIGVVIQVFFMVFAPGPGRLTHSYQSLTKVIYLFFDRVVGSALIPYWGFITSDQLGHGATLLLRGLAGVALSIVISYLVFHNVKQHRISFKNVSIAGISVGAYWVLAGVLINPEPRYAVAPGILLLFMVAINLDRCQIIGHPNLSPKLISNFFILLLACSWVTSLNPSKQLGTSVNWSDQVRNIVTNCNKTNLGEVELIGRPLIVPVGEKNQMLIVPCKKAK